MRITHSLFQRALMLGAACGAASLASPCVAWGPNGHRAAGAIAASYLTPEARKTVDDLLGGQSLADASNWADEIRSNSAYDWVKPLHYVNIPRGADSVDMARDCPNGQCVVGAIIKYKGVLADPSATREQRIEALKLLAHFVEDVHQPLHASYSDDKGGNMISLKLFNKKTNLHALWDSGMIDSRLNGASWVAWAESVHGKINDKVLREWRAATDPVVWADESVTITKRLYAGLPANGQVGQPYIDANFNTLEERIAAAGVRLAAAINEAVGGAGASEKVAETPKKSGKAAPAPTPATPTKPAPTTAPAAIPAEAPAGTDPKPTPAQRKPANVMNLKRASGSFAVKLTPQDVDAKAPPAGGAGGGAGGGAAGGAAGGAGSATIGRMSIEKEFHGDLEATSVGQMLSAMSSVQGSAGYVAIELVSGTLDGHRGTFVLQHSGTMNRGLPGLSVTVVPDSGTGELTGLKGQMKIVAEGGKHTYEFEYELPKI